MNNAIIFIKDGREKILSNAPYLGGNLLLHAVNELRKLEDIENIYVVGYDSEIPGVIRRDTIHDVIKELGTEGKTLLVSPLYPEINNDDYQKLLSKEGDAAGDAGLPQGLVLPPGKEGGFVRVHHIDGGHQRRHRQQTPNGLEAHGLHVIHAHALGHKGAAPDQGGQQNLNRSFELFVLHKITGGKIP
jgi:hypothetical protein